MHVISLTKTHDSYIQHVYTILRISNKNRQTSHISRTLVGNKIADHSDVVEASHVGAAPTTSSFSTWHMALIDWAKMTARGDEKRLSFGISCFPLLEI